MNKITFHRQNHTRTGQEGAAESFIEAYYLTVGEYR